MGRSYSIEELLYYTINTVHHTTPHYTTIHCTALHYTTQNYTTLHYTTLHCVYTAPSIVAASFVNGIFRVVPTVRPTGCSYYYVMFSQSYFCVMYSSSMSLLNSEVKRREPPHIDEVL